MLSIATILSIARLLLLVLHAPPLTGSLALLFDSRFSKWGNHEFPSEAFPPQVSLSLFFSSSLFSPSLYAFSSLVVLTLARIRQMIPSEIREFEEE